MSTLPLVDQDAERELLGAFFALPSALDSHPTPLDAWTCAAHEIIAGALTWLHDAEARISGDAVVSRLAQAQRLEAAGGAMVVYEIAMAYTHGRTIDALHDRVCTYAVRRRQREHLMRALVAVERNDDAEMVAQCSSVLAAQPSGTDEIHTMQSLGIESYHRATTPAEIGVGLVPTCIDAIDRDLIGSAPGDVMLVIAPTNCGKTSFALTMLEGLLCKGIRGGLIQFEDSLRLTGDRILSKHSRVPSRALRAGARDMTYDQVESITATAGVFAEMQPHHGYTVATKPGATEADAIRIASRMVRTMGCRVVVWDYAQAIRCSTREDNRRMELLTIGARFAAWALRNEVVGVLTSQVTEDADASPQCPKLNQTRDCRDLASQAASAIGLWENAEGIVMGRMLKSKVEGKGNRFALRRGLGGMFTECDVPESADARGYQRGRA